MSARADAPAALLFDLFGTLVFIDETRLATTTVGGRSIPTTMADLPGLLAERDLSVSVEGLYGALRAVGAGIEEERARHHVEIPSRERFRRALMMLGVEQDADAHAEALSLQHMDGLAAAVICPPDRVGLLAALSQRLPLGLVSNFDHGPTARRLIADFGLDAHLQVAVISDDAGVRKPGNAIFEHACAEIGVTAARTLHVGDSYAADVEGAVRAGLRAVWIDGGEGPHEPAAARIADVRELPDWLSARFAL